MDSRPRLKWSSILATVAGRAEPRNNVRPARPASPRRQANHFMKQVSTMSRAWRHATAGRQEAGFQLPLPASSASGGATLLILLVAPRRPVYEANHYLLIRILHRAPSSSATLVPDREVESDNRFPIKLPDLAQGLKQGRGVGLQIKLRVEFLNRHGSLLLSKE